MRPPALHHRLRSQRGYNRKLERASGVRKCKVGTKAKIWKKLEQSFRDTIEMIRADAKERGIDLDDPEVQAEVRAQERQERRLAAKNRPLARAAMAYLKEADKWFKESGNLFQEKGLE